MKSIKEFVFKILPADKWLKLWQVNNSPVVMVGLYALVYFGAKLHGINIPKGILSTVSINAVSSVIGNGATSLIKNIVKKGKASPEEIQEILNEISQRADKNIELSKKLLELDKELLKNEGFEKSISQLSESLHIDINNLKNEVNEQFDEIKEELRIISSSNIERMEAALCKDPESSSVCSGANKPELFRPTGPMWINFEKGYVVEREEVGEIIDKVKNSNKDIIVIKGKPASGKSVVLRSIGYHLINDGFTVYYIQLKFFQSVEVLEFNKIRHGIVIVDDAHLNIELTEKLIRNKSKEIKLIIGTRNLKEGINYSPTSEAHFPKLLKSAITIQSADAAEKIVDKFNKIHNGIVDNIIKDEILKSGNNLWILAWRLKAYEEYRELSTEKFKETVKNYISGLIKTNTISELTGTIFILSIFYKYEIPLRKPFVKNFTSEDIINELIRKNEIVQTILEGKDYLSLHHSEIARIYFDTFNEFKDFGNTIKNKAKELAKKYGLGNSQSAPKTDASLIINYTETFPEEFNRFIGQVPDEIKDILLQNKHFLNSVPEIFKNYQPFDDYYTLDFYEYELIPKIRRDKSLNSKIDTIGPAVFEEKIRKWDDPGDIGKLLEALKEVGYEKLNEMSKAVFEEKIRKWENPWDIGDLLEALKEAKYERLNEISKAVFEEKIRKWDDPGNIGDLLKALKEAKYERLNEISKAVFEEKIRKWDDPSDIGGLLKALKKVKYERLNEILEDIGPEVFEEKIRKCDDPGNIGYLLEALKEVEYERLNEILEDIGPEVFEEKIREWDDENDNEHLEKILKRLHYPHLEKLKELLEPVGLWLID